MYMRREKKTRTTKRFIVTVMTVLMLTSMIPSWAFAVEEPSSEEPSQPAVNQQLEQDDSVESSAESVTDSDSEDSSLQDENPESDSTADESTGVPGNVEVKATSGTNNILGDVLANMVNSYEDEDAAAQREVSLRKYPLDRHDLDYYGDSLRVRMVEGGDSEGSNYFVYRDTYLLIPRDECSNYTVAYSEDRTQACISPAIQKSGLKGKTGIVFLADDVGDDDILVFDGEPVYEEDSMTVPLLGADEITINQLFSDGKLSMEQEYSQPRNTRANSMLKGTSVSVPTVDFNKKVSGKNWSAEIDSFEIKGLEFDSHVDIFKLEASMTVSMSTVMGFKLESKGSTEGRSTARIASIKVPIKYVDFVVAYNMQFECDDNRLYMEGNMSNKIGFTLSSTKGREISQFSTPIVLDKYENRDQNDDREVRFYIGSQFLWQGGALAVTIPIINVDIGPIISVNQTNSGGCSFVVKKEKDKYTSGQRTGPEVHTCAVQGEPGCLDFDVSVLEHHRFFFRIDLYFWDKDFDLEQKLPKVTETYHMYQSLTYGSEIVRGYCPHHFYRVPVNVWSNQDMTTPVGGMDVKIAESVSHTPGEDYLLHDTTQDNGQAVLYLPIPENRRYTFIASGMIDNVSFAGTGYMNSQMQRGDNDPVDIVIGSDNKVTLKTNIEWNADIEGHETPDRRVRIEVFRREAGTDNKWESTNIIESADINSGWRFPDIEAGKFGAEGSRFFLYEYRVLVVEDAVSEIKILDPDADPADCYIERVVDAYVNSIGELEQEHYARFYMDYDAETTEDTVKTVITATPGLDMRVYKKWNLTDPDSSPVPVWIALLQAPEEGWESKAEERNTAADWLPVMNPIADGSEKLSRSSTLAQMQDEGVVTVMADVSSVSNTGMTISEVNAGNNWSMEYIVPVYRNGIKMQYKGGELDGQLIEKHLSWEYDLNVDADAKSFGDFVSVSGKPVYVDYAVRDLYVTNVNNTEEGMLRGAVYWNGSSMSDWNKVPESVELIINKNGEPTQDRVTLNKSDHSRGDVWMWTLAPDDYDPEAKYSVTEVCERGMLNQTWVPEYDGLDVYNSRIAYESVFVEARASFEGDPNIDSITTNIYDGKTLINTLELEKEHAWQISRPLGNNLKINEVKDISEYRFEAPDVPGYKKFIGKPEVKGGNNLTYSFSVRYLKYSDNLKLHITKKWENTDDSTDYPDSVEVRVYQDGIWINDVTISKDGDSWTEAVIDADREGNPLSRTDADGNKHVYTFIEEPADGFSSKAVLTRDDTDDVYYEIQNTWVGSDNVHIKGTVTWKGDEGKEHLRPDSVRLSVINSKGDYVRSIDVPVSDAGTYESKYLPAKDSDGNALSYSVLQSKASGYTSTYSEPSYDEETSTWTCDVTNTLTGYFAMKIKKVIDGVAPDDPQTYRFSVLPRTNGVPEGNAAPEPLETSIRISGAGAAEAEFLLDRDGTYYYTFKEVKGTDPDCKYDEKERLIIISRTSGDDGKAEFSSWVIEDPEDITDTDKLDKQKTDTVEFTNRYPGITVEKKWDIDLEGKDRPDSVKAVVQKKNGDSWTDVEIVELNGDNEWKKSISKPDENAEYRVRELRQDGTIGYLTDKIVYDKDDSDKGDAAPNEVIYSVNGYTSLLSGEEPDHKTEYQVSYKKDGDKYTITNKAILKMDAVKRWISTDEDKIPDSVWVVLLCTPKSGALDKAKSMASAAGMDFSSVLSYEFPVINPISGGINPVDLISQLTVGVDLSIFDKVLPTLAIGKATRDGNWKHEFVVSKYNMGIPMDYKGAELGSEILRQVIKYIAKVDLPVSYNPIQNFFSIPTKAIRTALGLTDLDFSGLSGKALEKAKTLSEDDLKNFGPETLLDDWHFMANVINLIIDWDTDDDDDDDPETRTIKGSKIWVGDEEENRPEYILIHIKDGAEEVDGSPVELKKTDFSGSSEWKWSIKVDADKYKDATFVVSEEWPENYEYKDYYACRKDGLDLTNTWQSNGTDTLAIQGQKIWKDEKNRDGIRPDKVIVYLLSDGTRVRDGEGNDLSVETNEAAGWRYFFPNQPKYNDKGQEIKYSVEEEPVEGYTSVVDEYNIINTHEPEKISIKVSKVWEDNDNQDGIRPKTVIVRLLSDGKDTGRQITLAEENNWTDTFTGMHRYAEGEAGKPADYTVEEVTTNVITGTDAPGTYSTETKGSIEDGFTITNTHTPETITLSGRKTWDDGDDQDRQRPDSIKVRLRAGGEEITSKEVTVKDGWIWEFKDLPKYRNGREIRYALTEDIVDNYTQQINGMNITNTHTPDKTQVNVYKLWEDNDDRDGIRPDFVTVRLLANGTDTGHAVLLNEANGWQGTFTGLDKNKNGKEIVYTVSEDPVTGYETEIIDGRQYDSPNSFIIRNTHKPETVTIKGEKIWEDDDDRDGTRPGKITVRLYWNGTPVSHREVTAADDWKWSFGEFYRNNKGIPYSFTISEDRVEDYTSEIKGDSLRGYTVTNRHTPGMTQVNVTGFWDDEDDRDGIRPDKVTIRLLADGKDTGRTLELTAEDNWTGTFADLYSKNEGKDIKYTVEQVGTDVLTGVDGPGTYANVMTGDAENGFVISNIHTPERISISGAKVWDDDDDRDGLRPDSIIVNLYSDGNLISSKIVTAEGGWKWSFDGFFKYQNGKELEYTISEEPADGYETEIAGDAESGFALTNSHSPEKTSVSVSKVWDDGDDHDSIRPLSVTVRLLADGADTGLTRRLSWLNGWRSSFDDLHVYSDGKKIAYTVEEVASNVIDGINDDGTYAYEITGDAENGFTITNIHTPWYTIDYDLNGGEFNNSKADIFERYKSGTEISIHEAPTRDGYTFRYWRGSEYQPGDKYVVTEDHTFIAQWEKKTVPDDPGEHGNPNDDHGNSSDGGSAQEGSRGPNTGDQNSPLLWIVALMTAIAGLGVVVLLRRYTDRREETIHENNSRT